MGTLTQNDTRLPHYCEHKLPTSCRLSSIPNCCACADERAHAPSYSTYIDGIGFVPRGNRWQRYCWYCKEFWEHRVEASGLRPGQTRIPQNPDQKEFLDRWYEFHRGYRIVKHSDGREERVAVIGEDFRNVSPGCLPRTLAEMREGRRAAEIRQQAEQDAIQAPQEIGPSLEETLEAMFEDAVHEEQTQVTPVATSPPPTSLQAGELQDQRSNIHAQAMNPAASRNREYQVRRVAALRRELTRMRTGIERVISGLRELGEDVPDDTESDDVIYRLNTTIERQVRPVVIEVPYSNTNSITGQDGNDIQSRIETTRGRLAVARETRNNAASVLENAETEFQDLQSHLLQLQREQRERRTLENYTRVFGTREEMIAQGENYESPIGGMFSRAMERFRAAEDVRREERTLRQVLEDEDRIDSDEAVARRLEELQIRERDVWGVPVTQHPEVSSTPRISSAQRSQDPATQAPADGRPLVTNVEVTTFNTGDENDNPTPPVLADTNEESVLQEYYAMIRRQDWSQGVRSSDQAGNESDANFPQNMLNAIIAARARELAERSANAQPRDDDDANELTSNDAPPPPQFSEDQWWHEDAEIIIRALTTDEALRDDLHMSAHDAAVLLAYFLDDYISESDRTTIDDLLRSQVAIWRTGLPSEWLKRRKELVHAGLVPEPGFFSGEGGYGGSAPWALHHNHYLRVEITAQAFMTSRAVRQAAPALSAPARLQMLYRLQAGSRTDHDVNKLEEMAYDEATFSLAQSVYLRNMNGDDDDGEDVERINASRREMLRNSDHSRTELDARRRDTSTRAFALAAGRQAMQIGSQALIEQAETANANALARDEQEAGTRAAFHRLQSSGFTRRPERTTLYRQLTLSDYLTSSAASSRSSSPEPSRGLDARDSGRPDPKSDEELHVSMECKICYTQMAEIACLPCGHLVMCRWCSEQHAPCLTHDRTRPRRPTGCPVCRKTVRQKVRVFRV